MIPAAFDYQRPATPRGGARAPGAGDEGTKVINGGQSLLPLLKLRLAEVDRLVDIGAARRSCRASARAPTGAWSSARR